MMDDCRVDILEMKLRAAYRENDELRKVASRMVDNLFDCCGECWLHGDVRNCGNDGCSNRKTYRMLCRLGIEVK